MSMKIDGTVALVTGANRGIGRAIVETLIERGAGKVYATARNPKQLDDLRSKYGDRLVPLKLDVTDTAQLRSVAEQVGDVQIVINNAGVALGQDVTSDDVVDHARKEMEVNYFAPLALTTRLAGTLKNNGGGAVVNISSVGGLTNFPFFPTYSASKAAIHSLSQGLRALLAAQNTKVLGVYPGPVDTDMARELTMDKSSPADVATAILDGIEAGTEEIFPDPFAVQFGEQYARSPKESERQVAAMVAEAAAQTA